MSNHTKQIPIILIISLVLGLIVSLYNQQDIGLSLLSGISLSAFTGVVAIILFWSANLAEQKGYPSWDGFFLVFTLNILGLLILLLLPSQKNTPEMI